MADHRLTRPQSSPSVLLIFKREKRKGDAVILETFRIRFFSLQLRVCSFTLPGFQISARRSLFSAAMLFFVVRNASLFSPKSINNSLLRDQKSKEHITGGCRKLIRAFKREAVQFLEANKTLP